MKNKISYKLIILVFLISTTVTSLSTYFHIKLQYENKISRFQKNLDNIEKNQIPLLIDSVWKVDYLAIDIFLNSITNNETIVFAKIIENDNIIKSVGLPKKSNIIKKEFHLIKKLNNETYNMGKLVVIADLTPFYRDLKNNIKSILVTEIIKILLLSLLIIFAVKKLIATRLEKIAKYTKELFINNSTEALKIKEKNKNNYDELDIVSNSINVMRLNLINYIKEREELLYKHNEELKEKINERNLEIEAKKKIEIKILQLNYNLEEKVSDRTRKLSQRTHELEYSLLELKETQKNLIESEKMASLGQLVAGVAHEINTPIGLSITGITHFLSESENIYYKYKNNQLTEEDFKEFIDSSNEIAKSININLKKSAKLVKSFKEISVDQSIDDKRVFIVKDYLEEILVSMGTVLKNMKINIACDNSLKINSFPGALSQIITNLIFNSLNHAYDKQDKSIVSIDIKENNKSIIITFKDYGIGISKENLTKIFDPFFTTNRKNGGTGLGLSIVYNLVTQKLNGTINCESKEMKGTTFIIILSTN